MNIIFFGSDPWFSPPVLEALLKAGHEVPIVITKGDALAKNKKQKTKNKIFYLQAKTAEDISLERLMVELDEIATAAAKRRPRNDRLTVNDSRFTDDNRPEAIVLASFGPPFLPAEVLNWPKYGCLNVHASLLPRWRGASPVFGALENGDKETGVSIMRMTEEIDLGNILEQKAIQINQPSKNNSAPAVRSPLPWSPSTRRGVATAGFGRTSDFSDEKSGSSEKPYDTRETLTKKLGKLGGKLIVETLKKLENGQINEVKQPPKSPTPYTHRLTKDSGRIDWKKSPERIERFIRAVTPWPGAQTRAKFEIRSPAWTSSMRSRAGNSKFEIKELKILKAHLEPIQYSLPAAATPQALQAGVFSIQYSLVIDLVQLPGKNPISWKAFLAGHPDITLVHGPKKPKSRL